MNHIWVYNSGMDFRFSELSLGWVLLGHLLEWANEHNVNIRLHARDEQYKYVLVPLIAGYCAWWLRKISN